MKLASILLLLLTVPTTGMPQEKASIGDFTNSSTEHIINRIEKPFIVRSVRGSVIRKEGFREPLADVLFEIQGPGDDKKIRKGTTDQHGRFHVANVPTGTYEFKTTLNGFQSVMGTVVVSSKARKVAEIKLEIAVGV